MKAWIIECMCVVCHGPMKRGRNGIDPIVCGANCRGYWYQGMRNWKRRPVGGGYQLMRVMQAYRRSQMLVALRMATLAGDSFARQWLIEELAG